MVLICTAYNKNKSRGIDRFSIIYYFLWFLGNFVVKNKINLVVTLLCTSIIFNLNWYIFLLFCFVFIIISLIRVEGERKNYKLVMILYPILQIVVGRVFISTVMYYFLWFLGISLL